MPRKERREPIHSDPRGCPRNSRNRTEWGSEEKDSERFRVFRGPFCWNGISIDINKRVEVQHDSREAFLAVILEMTDEHLELLG